MQFKILISFALFSLYVCDKPWIGIPRDDAWKTKHEKLVNQTIKNKDDIQIVFLGDSITEGWAGNGAAVWKQYYTPRHAYNYGIGGDRVEHVIWRIENKEFDDIKPKVVILKIGTNNLGANTQFEIAVGIYETLKHLTAKLPDAKILNLGILPRNGTATEAKVQDINSYIAKLADNKSWFYLDMSDKFQTSPGVEIEGLFTDTVHLTAKGYQVWYDTMEPTLAKLLA